MQAFLRSGCVHLTFETLRPKAEQLPTWEQLNEALGAELLSARATLLQLSDKAALVAAGGQLADCFAVELPAQLQQVSPRCVVAGQDVRLQLRGRLLGSAGIKLHARSQGHFLKLEPAVAPHGDPNTLAVQLPAMAAPGRVCLELEEGLLIGEPLQLLVVPDKEMADEVCRLEGALPRGQAEQVGPRCACSVQH
jgi:hypothetical protein